MKVLARVTPDVANGTRVLVVRYPLIVVTATSGPALADESGLWYVRVEGPENTSALSVALDGVFLPPEAA